MPAPTFRLDPRPESGAYHYSLEKIVNALIWIKSIGAARFDTERLHHLTRGLGSAQTMPSKPPIPTWSLPLDET
jgi:hypothetical protein